MLKKIKKAFGRVKETLKSKVVAPLAVAIGVGFAPTSGYSAVVPADFAIDTADIGTIAGALLSALGVIWIAKRVVGFLGR